MAKEILVDGICHKIRMDIIGGVLPQGEKIRIKDLTARYAVSETPIKQALNRLATEHLIESNPRRGMWVKSISPLDVEQTFDLRLMLDLYYMSEIIETVNCSRDLQNEMTSIIERHNRIVSNKMKAEDFLDNYKYDFAFHELYLKCSGNAKIVDLFTSLNPLLYSSFIYQKQSREREIEGAKEHERIFNAILAKDIETLRAAITDHLENSKRSISLILRVDSLL
ncbi:MAG: GntR family transcriptional regulator [Gracilibacteraceae bacterium]|jgi:DNA-binding GntR family transcriptional regulator|nr:GntR family transcriptional regulator [Gracilibacteraceae bacterium]